MSDYFQDLVMYDLPRSTEVILDEDDQQVIILTVEKISQDEKNLLIKILSAAKISGFEVYAIPAGTWIKVGVDARFENRTILVFGLHPRKLGLAIDPPLNTLFELRQRKLFFTASLKDLMASQDHKKVLWSALQKQFLV